MTEQEKEAIETRKHIIEIDEGLYGEDSENFKTDKIILNYIGELQKELEEKTTILMAGAEKVKQLEKENQELKEDNSHQWEERCRLTFELEKLQKENEELKEENIILEGNKIGYKLAIQELEKTIDLIIDDFQAENYFVGMTNKEVREYYKKRNELKE